jgi:hypothetical protein
MTRIPAQTGAKAPSCGVARAGDHPNPMGPIQNKTRQNQIVGARGERPLWPGSAITLATSYGGIAQTPDLAAWSHDLKPLKTT